jgi:ATP-dependent RNA helicase DDX46/PRP5
MSISYIKFRKNFYIESKEILDMEQVDVDDYRKKLGDIVVRGRDAPRPIKNWY